ncbi:MAG: DUF697 domain-containing protein [Vallitaleaceae bacterium]|jgi:hypothetical protein|nr:DUF697 domain-containing protein [Vallitaleaceae bacterium]
MKFMKLLFGFIIFYFIVVVFSSMVNLAEKLSMGNQWLLVGFYVFMGILFIRYILYPLLKYIGKPSIKDYTLMFDHNKKAASKIKKYLKRHLDVELVDEIKAIDDPDEFIAWCKAYLEKEVAGFSKIIKTFAFKLSSAVLLSPNSFLDGITILYGNSNMIYTLSKRVHVRYNGKQLWNMYFSIMSVASISGLIEEFDDVMIDIFEELLESIAEKLGEEAGASITSSIPIVSIATKATSYLLQSAGNFAFIVYNGNKFKYMIENLYLEDKLTQSAINKASRAVARKSKLKYVSDLSKGVGSKFSFKGKFNKKAKDATQPES